ncbi:MAG: STAS domain-containing protein [Sulfitobacter sp.]|nr:STAS domain-containing protein [Sulfitobacter sp.]
MQLSTQVKDQMCLVTVEESRIDAAVALSFKEAMRRVTEGAGPLVLLDLSQVDFIDSSGLGALVGSMKALAPERELRLAGMTPPVRKVLELTRMDTVFTLYDTVDAGLEDTHG